MCAGTLGRRPPVSAVRTVPAEWRTQERQGPQAMHVLTIQPTPWSDPEGREHRSAGRAESRRQIESVISVADGIFSNPGENGFSCHTVNIAASGERGRACNLDT